MMTYENAIKKLWTDTCTVYTAQKTVDAHGLTSTVMAAVISDEACRISFAGSSASMGGNVDSVSQNIKLFLRKDAVIPAGSRIDVTRNGKTTSYKLSDQPAYYDAHQEISLVLAEERA